MVGQCLANPPAFRPEEPLFSPPFDGAIDGVPRVAGFNLDERLPRITSASVRVGVTDETRHDPVVALGWRFDASQPPVNVQEVAGLPFPLCPRRCVFSDLAPFFALPPNRFDHCLVFILGSRVVPLL